MRMIVSLVNCYLTIPNGAKANGFFLPPTPPHMCAVHTQSRFSMEHHLSTFPQNYVNNDEFVVWILYYDKILELVLGMAQGRMLDGIISHIHRKEKGKYLDPI